MPIPGSEDGSATFDSTEGGSVRRSFAFLVRGGRCFGDFLDRRVQGKKTPVPLCGTLLGLRTIGCIGANMTIGARSIPHLGIAFIAS